MQQFANTSAVQYKSITFVASHLLLLRMSETAGIIPVRYGVVAHCCSSGVEVMASCPEVSLLYPRAF